MPEINKTLFRKVRNKILKFPDSYNQASFCHKSSISPCGTQACIFGWAIFLSEERNIDELYSLAEKGDYNFYEAGKHLLGLNEWQAQVVAAAGGIIWPEPFSTRFILAKTPKEASRIAADYINWIIKNNRVT